MITAIIQARMSSTRLPNKVMAEISGKPMLWYVVNRTRKSAKVDRVIVATSNQTDDDVIARFCGEEKIPYYRGSIDDVLDRFYQTAREFGGEVIVRITSDCPLIDPAIIDKVVDEFLENDFDYVSNTVNPTYPDGLDVEVIKRSALDRAWKEARLKSEREHVTPYIFKNPSLFKVGSVQQDEDLSALRWTVDEPEDLEFVRAVYDRMESLEFGMRDVLSIIEKHPEISEINQNLTRNEGYAKSLREDEEIKELKAKI